MELVFPSQSLRAGRIDLDVVLVTARSFGKRRVIVPSTGCGFVCQERSKVASCCALDEGRPLGAALQEEASNHHERLLPNGDGRERHGQKVRLDRVRYG